MYDMCFNTVYCVFNLVNQRRLDGLDDDDDDDDDLYDLKKESLLL